MGDWRKTLVLSSELIKTELPPWKIGKAYVLSVSLRESEYRDCRCKFLLDDVVVFLVQIASFEFANTLFQSSFAPSFFNSESCWVPFHGIFSSCQGTGFFLTALYILRRQPVGHSLGCQQGKAHPKCIVAHSRLELIELTGWVRHDYPKQLLPQFPLTTLPVKPIFSQKNDLNVYLLVAH